MQLHMEPEAVQETIRRLSRLQTSLETAKQQLTNYTTVAPWWEGPSAQAFETEVKQTNTKLQTLLDNLINLIQRLKKEREEWLRAAEQFGDGHGVPRSTPAPTPNPTPTPPPQVTPSPGTQTHYTPRFDGSKPAPGMDSTYGKPGQLPLDAVVKSTPDNRDPYLYEDVINQFAVGNNPRYAPDKWTYCNTFAGDVARAMGHPFPTKAEWGLNPRDRATIAMPDLWRYFTDPKAPIRAAEQGWREIRVDNLQELERYVNSGKMAVAVTSDHIAVIRPNQRITDLAHIRIAQAGATNANNIPLVRGFGQKRLGQIRIFVHD